MLEMEGAVRVTLNVVFIPGDAENALKLPFRSLLYSGRELEAQRGGVLREPGSLSRQAGSPASALPGLREGRLRGDVFSA